MRISTKLTLAALVPAVVAALAVAGVLISYFPTVGLQNRQVAIVQARGDLDQVDGLARSYLLHHDARSSQQFMAASDDVVRDITKAASGSSARDQQTLATVAQDAQAVRELFVRIVAIHEAGIAAPIPADREAEERLSEQLFIRSTDAKGTIGELVQSISAEIVTRERRTSETVTVLTILAAALLTAGLVALRRDITRSLQSLHAGTEAIGGGDLDYRIGLPSADEFGDLGRAFDRMSERLKGLTFRQEWLSGVSHDIRTPLSSIRGYAELLADERSDLPDEERRQAGIIASQTQRVQQLVEDLLLTFQVREGSLPLRLERIDLSDFLLSVVDSARAAFPSGADSVSCRLPSLSHFAMVDRKLLERALINLIGNALVHNPAGTHVAVLLTSADDSLEVSVRDDGRGMDEESLGRVWVRYERGSDVGKDTDGIGLGMSVARQLVEAMNGSVEIASMPGAGTTVVVRLPSADTPP